MHNPGTRRLSELLLTIGGARACGYGVTHKGNTGCGIETVLVATRSKAKNAHPDWQGAKVGRKVDVDSVGVSLNSALISKSGTSKKILDILLLGNKEQSQGSSEEDQDSAMTLSLRAA